MYTELLPGFEPAGVLLSIRPAYADLIASGAKTIELRRRFPNLPMGSLLVFYATKPVGAVLGLAQLRSITAETLPRLWRKFGLASRVSKHTFDRYFDECSEGFAIEISDFVPFTPPLSLVELRETWPEFIPPQSYRYVPDIVLRKLRAMARIAGSPGTVSRTRSNSLARRTSEGPGK